MSAWDELVTTALLGTDRRGLPDSLADTLPGSLGGLVAAQDDPALAVLDGAAGYAGYRHAGARPVHAPEPPLAPRQRVDLAPEPAQRLLGDLLAAREVALVEEWLAACTSRGLGVRAGLWAPLAVLAATASGPDRSLVRRALGERGEAFVGLNPRWRRALEPEQPARAPEGPDAGAPSDLLTARAVQAVRVSRSLGRRRVVVQPPVPDEALVDQGVPPRPPQGSSLDPAAHLLRRVVAGADLDAWRPHTGLSPGDLLELLHSGVPGWYADLVAALTEATVDQRHQEWATALLRAGVAPAELSPLVDPDDLGRIADGWVGSRADPDTVARLLSAVPSPWPERVADAALRHLVSTRPRGSLARRLGLALGHAAPLSFLGDVAGRGLGEAEQVLGTRVAIQRGFDPAPTTTRETP
jgi:hypothetical protein